VQWKQKQELQGAMQRRHRDEAPRIRPRLATAGSGLAAGLISSLAISGLLLLVERMSELPVGTFYLVLVSALVQTQDYSAGAAAIGFMMHLAAGSVIGAALSVPLMTRKMPFATGSYASLYGLVAGFALWAGLFLPITYGMMIPLLNSVGGQESITQQVPNGRVYAIATGDLLAMMDRVVVGALAFNLFYGLLAVTLARSMYEAQRRGKTRLPETYRKPSKAA
jgi:hypothetical protein